MVSYNVNTMTPDIALPTFHLRFEGEAARNHTVPATALVQAAQALQRAIYLLAFAHEGKDLGQRFRIDNEIERKYPVVFKVPQGGSYDIPYAIGEASTTLLGPIDLDVVINQHVESLEAIANSDMPALRRIIPQGEIRRKYLASLGNMQPKRAGLVVSIRDNRNKLILDGNLLSEKLSSLLSEPSSLPAVMPRLVTGRLDALDFQARKLTLTLYSGRTIDCVYSEDFEPTLLENRREIIQVRGEAVLNDKNELKALNNVTEIIEIDEGPLSIDHFHVNAEVKEMSTPLIIGVKFDQEGGIYIAEGDYNIVVAAENRDELEAEARSMLEFLWREYVMKSPIDFTDDAKSLRDQLKTMAGDKNAD